MLDCNGHSPVQQRARGDGVHRPARHRRRQPARFFDNGLYIGHDEPIIRFVSSQPGSGNDVTWRETLPRDPDALPTVAHPGSDVTHWFELSIAPWFSMALCNPQSYPLRRASRTATPTPRPATSTRAAAAARSWRCSSTRQASRRSSTTSRATTSTGARRCTSTTWSATTASSLQPQLRGADELRVHPANGVPTGPPSPQLSDARLVHAERRDAADEPRRPDPGAHLRRASRVAATR